jgi:hypothetical protein
MKRMTKWKNKISIVFDWFIFVWIFRRRTSSSVLLMSSLNTFFVGKLDEEEDVLKLKASILYLSFNQTGTLFSVGLDQGYQIFSCDGVTLQDKEGFSTGGIGKNFLNLKNRSR